MYKNFFICMMDFPLLKDIRADFNGTHLKENHARMTSELQSFRAAGTQLRPVPYSHRELGRSITEISRRDVGREASEPACSFCMRTYVLRIIYVHFA